MLTWYQPCMADRCFDMGTGDMSVSSGLWLYLVQRFASRSPQTSHSECWSSFVDDDRLGHVADDDRLGHMAWSP